MGEAKVGAAAALFEAFTAQESEKGSPGTTTAFGSCRLDGGGFWELAAAALFDAVTAQECQEASPGTAQALLALLGALAILKYGAGVLLGAGAMYAFHDLVSSGPRPL